jgi:predicted MFS family arabinose efflux permease
LLNGLFAVLFGTALCGYVSKKFSLKTIMIVSLLLNIGAIYLFTINVSVIMLIIVVVVLAIANIFTLTNIQTYYATLYQNSRVSSMKALSVYSAVENMSMAIGPLVFSYILAYNIVTGMRLLAGVLLICLILFIIISALTKDKKGKK